MSASGCPHTSHRLPDKKPVRESTGITGADAARRDALQAWAAANASDDLAVADAATPHADTGFASDVDAFRDAVNAAHAKTGLDTSLIVHDYWLVRTLHGVADAFGKTCEMVRHRDKGQRVPVGRWVFGGGTSLTAAWQIGDRYSEDIDGNLFVEHDEISKSVRHKVCKEVLDAALGGIDRSEHVTKGDRVRTTKVSLGRFRDYLKFETTVQDLSSDFVDRIVEPRRVTSIVGQHAAGIDIERFPELGGFEMLCIRPAWTAVNKFDALHRRAIQSDLRGIEVRGRDLYDLWAIANSVHANDVRSQIPELWERAASGIRAAQPRPSSGYGYAEVFTVGTDANKALRAGYENAVSDTVWGETPPFSEALNAARELDD